MDDYEFKAIMPSDTMKRKDFGIYGSSGVPAPKVIHLDSTGDAERYEYVASNGVTHCIVITGLEHMVSGKSRLHLVRDRIQRIESDVAGSAET